MDTKTNEVTPQELATTLREASPWAREVIERAIVEARNAALEEAAKAVDAIAEDDKPDGTNGGALERAAEAIRALKT